MCGDSHALGGRTLETGVWIDCMPTSLESSLWCRELSGAARAVYGDGAHWLFKPIVGVSDLMRDAQRVVTVCEHPRSTCPLCMR